MSIAITEDHRALAETAAELPPKRDARGAARALLEAPTEELPELWDELVELGWLGLHLPEDARRLGLRPRGARRRRRGARTGRRARAVRAHRDRQRRHRGGGRRRHHARRCCPAWPTAPWPPASRSAARHRRRRQGVRVAPSCSAAGWPSSSSCRPATTSSSSRSATASPSRRPPNLDTHAPLGAGHARRRARHRPRRRPPDPHRPRPRDPLRRGRRPGPRVHRARPRPTRRSASSSAGVIGMYQAVKHHCANMVVATELATSAVWDAARAAATGGDQLSYAAAVAATLAAPAADLCANLNTQVHGGIAITWEHDAHLYMRRATTLLTFLEPARAAADLTDLTRRGVVRAKAIELPPEAEAIRDRGAGLRREHQGPLRRRAAHPADRDRLRDAALAQALRPRGRRHRAARDRAGVRRRRHQAPAVRHHRVEHPHDHPVRQPGPARPLGARRRSTRRSSGASSSASPTPAPTPPASRPRPRGSTAAGSSTARRCGPPAPTSPAWASPPCAPTPTCPSTRASR